jgi:hypothetical protein
MRRFYIATAAFLVGATPLLAQTSLQGVANELRRQGFTAVAVERDDGRIKVEAYRGGLKREIVYNAANGQVISDRTRSAGLFERLDAPGRAIASESHLRAGVSDDDDDDRGRGATVRSARAGDDDDDDDGAGSRGRASARDDDDDDDGPSRGGSSARNDDDDDDGGNSSRGGRGGSSGRDDDDDDRGSSRGGRGRDDNDDD